MSSHNQQSKSTVPVGASRRNCFANLRRSAPEAGSQLLADRCHIWRQQEMFVITRHLVEFYLLGNASPSKVRIIQRPLRPFAGAEKYNPTGIRIGWSGSERSFRDQPGVLAQCTRQSTSRTHIEAVGPPPKTCLQVPAQSPHPIAEIGESLLIVGMNQVAYMPFQVSRKAAPAHTARPLQDIGGSKAIENREQFHFFALPQ